MSKIYPNKLPSEIINDPKFNAEVALFNSLKSAKLFSTTRIYHSVDWINKHAKWDIQKDGECDFIITDEKYGIIFIEVKGGNVRKDENNNWWSGKESIKNPFAQCKKSMHRLMEEFTHRWVNKFSTENYPKFFYQYFVFFPNVGCKKNTYLGAAYDKERIGFRDDLKDPDTIANRILEFFELGIKVKNQHEKLGKESQEIFHEMFTKTFEFKKDLKDEIEDNNFSIDKLTNEQTKVLEGSHSTWKTLWCEGPAGSGKTVIAIKKFLKEYEALNQGKFLFLCRNKKISEKIKEKINLEIKNKNKNMYFIGTFDKFCKEILNSHDFNLDFKNLDKSYEKVFDITSSNEYKKDVIIIDESQVFDEIWWTIIENIRADESILWVFGDSNQRIWKRKKPDIKGANPEPVFLSRILRNSRIIAEKSLSFFDGGVHGLTIDGPISNRFEITATNNFHETIRSIHKELNFEGVSNDSIIVLTSDKGLRTKIEGIESASISSYAGMESDCIIFIIDDLNKYDAEKLYVGMTRAKTYLNILCKPEDEDKLKKLLI
tara:strand:- start:2099 stop:3733 length:1635 start_codon:yes stop_codon:yes gene_type:complete